ncbi:MAG: hypothetical protein ACE5PV_00730 [Candidatus Poribacteria bacterium]
MFLNDKRLCDTCIFMADSCHLDMCLHPLRRERGKLGKMINNALVWNGNCSAYIQGKPCFYELIDYSDEPKEIWKYSEQVYQLLVRRFAESGKVTANDLAEALAQKHIQYASEEERNFYPNSP